MKEPTVSHALIDVIEWYYRNNDPTAAWPDDMVFGLLAAARGGRDRSRYATMAALALDGMDSGALASFESQYEIPGNVSALRGTGALWPDATDEEDPIDLEVYRLRMLSRLNEHAEFQAHRVIWGGDRMAQTYRKKEDEALLVIEHNLPETLTDAEIPYIYHEALATNKTHETVAQEIMAQVVAWKAWDSAVVEPARQQAQLVIRTATTAAEIRQAVESARITFETAMNSIPGATP